jgi:hypothetical protein
VSSEFLVFSGYTSGSKSRLTADFPTTYVKNRSGTPA